MASVQPSFPSPKPPDPAVSNKLPSFADIVSGSASSVPLKPRFPPLALPARQVGTKEGKPSICFSSAEIGACERRFEHSIIAKFTVGRPRLAEIQCAFRKAWPTSGRVSISGIWDSRHLLVIFDSEEDVRAALSSPLNKVGHAFFRLFRWSPDYNPKRESAITTIWVRLPALPISIYDSAFIEAIVSTFGYFVSVDARTKACTALNYARACVELDVTKEIPPAVWVNLPDNRGYWQTIEIESNISFCSKCRIHGHKYELCRKRKDKQQEQSRPAKQFEGGAQKDPIHGLSKEARNNGGAEFEWRPVISKKLRKSQGGHRNKEPIQGESKVSSIGEETKANQLEQSLDTTDDNTDKAMVIYVKSDVGLPKQQSFRQDKDMGAFGYLKNKTKIPFSDFIPKDLSGAERRIRNKANNVLIFDETSGVLAHPDALPHYQQIRAKAGTIKNDYLSSDMDTSEDEGEITLVTEGEGSTGSKHYSLPMSQ